MANKWLKLSMCLLKLYVFANGTFFKQYQQILAFKTEVRTDLRRWCPSPPSGAAPVRQWASATGPPGQVRSGQVAGESRAPETPALPLRTHRLLRMVGPSVSAPNRPRILPWQRIRLVTRASAHRPMATRRPSGSAPSRDVTQTAPGSVIMGGDGGSGERSVVTRRSLLWRLRWGGQPQRAGSESAWWGVERRPTSAVGCSR